MLNKHQIKPSVSFPPGSGRTIPQTLCITVKFYSTVSAVDILYKLVCYELI